MAGEGDETITGRPADTSAEAHARQREIYRAMTGAARVQIAFELSDAARNLTLAGIRRRHPTYTDEHVQQAWARLVLGDPLCLAAWPDRPLIDP